MHHLSCYRVVQCVCPTFEHGVCYASEQQGCEPPLHVCHIDVPLHVPQRCAVHVLQRFAVHVQFFAGHPPVSVGRGAGGDGRCALNKD
jgi:hypothetical protein